MVPRLQELRNVLDSPSALGWTVLADDTEKDIHVELKKSVRGLQLMRARGTIDAPPKDVYRCCQYTPFRVLWDINNDFLLLKKKIGVNAYIAHIKTKKKFVISARDFVVNYLINQDPDGTVSFVSSSDDCDFSIPELSSVVRAYTALSGIVLKPHPTDKNKTIMHSCVEIDLKGSIPEFGMKGALKDQGYQIDRIRGVITKWKALFPGDEPVQVEDE